MDLELDGIVRSHTKVVPWEKFGNDWPYRYEQFLYNESFKTPGSKIDLGKATGESLFGVVHYEDVKLANAG